VRIAAAPDEVDEQPDDPDDDQKRREGDEQPEAAWKDHAVSVNGSLGRQGEFAGREGQIASYRGAFRYGEVAAQHSHVA